ncbi:mitochondrial import inner membrane translocase subunit Tim23-like [Asterias rubens]|nr:mitochondrial import inner membrane translocase subunit Tim23-like [Asterias rubens]
MMDQQNSGIFGSFGTVDPRLNVSVPSGAGASISPYLNVDPYYLNQGGPQFIVPTGQARARGRFELAFSQIGSSVMAGAVYGALNGVRISTKETRELSGKVRVSQMLNLVTKQGASSANVVGVIALMYSILGLGLSWGRGTEDELNTLGAATATGLLYKSSAGLKTMAKGGAAGLGIATIWCLWQNKDRLKSWNVQSL